jgi:death-on-curing family protein
MNRNILTIQQVQFIAHELASKYMRWDEPIPDFSTRFPNILESCLLVPFQTFDKKYVYKGLVGKASILFYLMIKNHPFQNGNKRLAVTTLLVFLANNGKWLRVSNQEFYNFAVWVAQSPPAFKDQVISAVNKFIKDHLAEV